MRAQTGLEEKTTKRKTYSALVRGPPLEHRRVREVVSRRGVSAVATVMSRASPPPFCYLEPIREGASPYSLTLSSEKPATGNFAILSRAGVLRVTGAETESLQAKEELKERALFTSLRKIPFFKTYGRWKPFVVWKKATRRLKFVRSMRFLEGSRCMDFSIVSGHCQLRNELLVLDLLIHQPRTIMTPAQLCEQQKLVTHRAVKCVADVVDNSAIFLVSLADRLVITALKDMPEVQSKAREEVLISGILTPSFAVEALSFTERGVIRGVLRHVHAFARLVEFQQRAALAKNLELALATFGPPLQLELMPDGCTAPSREATLSSVQAALILALDAAASSVALLSQPAVKALFTHAELPQTLEPLADIVRSPEMQEPSAAKRGATAVLVKLGNDFDSLLLKLQSPSLLSLVEMCQRRRSFPLTFSLGRLLLLEDVDLVRQLLEANALDKVRVQNQPHTITAGSLSVSTTAALICAMDSLNACRAHLDETLPALFVHKAKLFCDEMSSLSSRLAQGLQSSSVEEFVDAVDLHALTIDGKWKLSCNFDELAAMNTVFFEDHSVTPSDESVAYSRTIHAAWREFENSLDSFSAAVGRESKARIGELERRVRLLTSDLDGMLSFVQGQGNPTSDAADVLAGIERFTARAAALADRAVELDRLQKALDADVLRLEPFLHVTEKIASTKVLWETKVRLDKRKDEIFSQRWPDWLLADCGEELRTLVENAEESISTHCVRRLHRDLEAAVSRTIDELKAVAAVTSIIKAGEEPSARLRAVLGVMDDEVADVAKALLQAHVADLLQELAEE